MKRKYGCIIAIIAIIISAIVVFNSNSEYIILNEDNSYKYKKLLSIHKDIDIYNASREEFDNLKINENTISAVVDVIKSYNKSVKQNKIENANKAKKITKDFYKYLYNETKYGVFQNDLM